jgi:mannan endo-1,4-beta-mannosidase
MTEHPSSNDRSDLDRPGRTETLAALSRRGLLLGAGTAGGLVLGAAPAAHAATSAAAATGVGGPGAGLSVWPLRPRHFVTVKGGRFRVAGTPWRFGGTNCYYLHESSHYKTDSMLNDAAAMSMTVVRAWAFIDGAAHNGYALQPEPYSYDEDSFEPLDYAVWKAGQLGLRLVLPLVNNWPDYGGMQQYVTWFLGLADDSYGDAVNHDKFYTDAAIRRCFRAYAKHVIGRRNRYTGLRYNEDPTIMTFELANEPRNRSDKTGAAVLAWADEMSRYIKQLAPRQLVAVGDEGFFGDPANFDYPYSTYEGNKWRELSTLRAVDYATYHLYPQGWGEGADPVGWGETWISDHIAAGRQLGKPTVLEEYGLRVDASTGVPDADTRDAAYRRWTDRVLSAGGDGDQFWILTARQDDGTLYPDYDGFRVVYPSSTAGILVAHARQMASSTVG